MDADNVCAIHDRHCHCSSRGVTQFLLAQSQQEGLPRRAHHHGIIERHQATQLRNDLGILFLTLTEAQARIERNAVLLHACHASPACHRFQFADHRSGYVRNRPQPTPRLGSAPHVV